MRLARKIAIVTGAGSGFGEGIAQRFAEEGAKVVVADIDSVAGGRVAGIIAQKHGADAVACLRTDVTVAKDVKAMVAETMKKFGRVDVMVNNAGYTHRNKPLLNVTEAEFDRVFEVNVKSIYLSSLEVAPIMRDQEGGGVILNTASTAGLRPRPGLTWYNGSKGAVVTITKSMAAELATDGIRVNALCPVVGLTGMFVDFIGEDTEERREKFLATIPLGRFSQPKDIAAAAVFLASDEAAFLTGLAMEIDGGRCI